MAGPAQGQIEWRRLATDKNVSIPIAQKLWEQAKAAAADPAARSTLFRKLIDEAAKNPTATPEPGKANLVDQKGPNDPASLGPGKTTQVLLNQDQKPGVAKPPEEKKDAAAPLPAPAGKDAAAAKDAAAGAPGADAKKKDEPPTAKPTVDKLRNDLIAAGQAAKDVGAMLAQADPATIMEALRQLRDGDPNLLHKILTVAGSAIEARIGKKFPDPVANKVDGPVGIRVPYDGGDGMHTHFISDAGVPMVGASPVAINVKVAEWTAEIKKRDAANQPVAQSVARVTALGATATEQAKKAKDGDDAAKKALEGTQKQLATELGNTSRQMAQPPTPAPATEQSKHAAGPPPANWREQVAKTIASEKVVADDPGHTYHVLKTGRAVATSKETELDKPTAELAATRSGVVVTPEPAPNPQAPPGLKSAPAIQAAASGALIGDPLPNMGQGHAVLGTLSQGNANGLAPVGVLGTLPFQANSIEWGLDEWQPHNQVPTSGENPGPAPTATNVFRIIKGDTGGVPVLPNYVRHGHSHPVRATDITGLEQNLTEGKPGTGSMKLNDLLRLDWPKAYILPSSSDFHYTFLHNVPRHVVHTPYQIDPKTLEVINPTRMRTVMVQTGVPLAFVIDRSLFRKEGLSYVGTLIGTAGGAEVWRGQFAAAALEAWGGASPDLVGQPVAQQQAGQPPPGAGGQTLAAQAPQQAGPEQKPAGPQQAAPEQKPAAPQQAAPEQKPAAPQQAAPEQKPAAPQQAAPEQKPAAPQQAAPEQKPAAPPQQSPAQLPAVQHPPQQPVAPQAQQPQQPAAQAQPVAAANPAAAQHPPAQQPGAQQPAPPTSQPDHPSETPAEPVVETTTMSGAPHTLRADPTKNNIEFNSIAGWAVQKLQSVVNVVPVGVRQFAANALSIAIEATATVADPSLKIGGKPNERPAVVKRLAEKLRDLAVSIRLFGDSGQIQDADPGTVEKSRQDKLAAAKRKKEAEEIAKKAAEDSAKNAQLELPGIPPATPAPAAAAAPMPALAPLPDGPLAPAGAPSGMKKDADGKQKTLTAGVSREAGDLGIAREADEGFAQANDQREHKQTAAGATAKPEFGGQKKADGKDESVADAAQRLHPGQRDSHFNPVDKVNFERALAGALLANLPTYATQAVNNVSTRIKQYFERRRHEALAEGLENAHQMFQQDLAALTMESKPGWWGAVKLQGNEDDQRLADMTLHSLDKGSLPQKLAVHQNMYGVLQNDFMYRKEITRRILGVAAKEPWFIRQQTKMKGGKLDQEQGKAVFKKHDVDKNDPVQKAQADAAEAERGRVARLDGGAVSPAAPGIQARDREGHDPQSVAPGFDTQMVYRGLDAFTMDEAREFCQRARLVLNMPLAAGVSGSTAELIGVANTLGLSMAEQKRYAVAVIAYIAGGGNHSYHEIAVVLAAAGLIGSADDYSGVEELVGSTLFTRLKNDHPGAFPGTPAPPTPT